MYASIGRYIFKNIAHGVFGHIYTYVGVKVVVISMLKEVDTNNR